MKLVSKVVLAAFMLGLVGLSQAAVYDIDPAHSQVGFKVRHFVSKTPGRFKTFSGTVNFDEKKPADLKADATIQTDSVDTNNDKRDGHLKSADFFNVEKYPTMTFKSTSAKLVSPGKVQLMGNLTLLGVTKPVTLDVDVSGPTPDPWGASRVGFSGTGKINRKDFGMIWNKTMDSGGVMLGDEVEIQIDIEGVSQAKKK